MKKGYLRIHLLQDTTFGRGDGVAGVVDSEVQHDDYGLPYVGGRALKGMLAAECADIVYALSKGVPADKTSQWQETQTRLFGKSGGTLNGEATLRVGAAQLPEDLRLAIAKDKSLTREEVLESLTTIRRQTAIAPETGAPKKESLRAMRVVLRETEFEARIEFSRDPQEDELALLAAAVKAFRHAGTGRNRGRGLIRVTLLDENRNDVTETHFKKFRDMIEKEVSK